LQTLQTLQTVHVMQTVHSLQGPQEHSKQSWILPSFSIASFSWLTAL
jgi:hypothetical protein